MNAAGPNETTRLTHPPAQAPGLSADGSARLFSTTAVAALIFCGISVVLYAGVSYLAWQLPAGQAELEALRTNTPQLLKILIAGGAALLCNLVALILSLAGLAARHESTLLAVLGAVLSSVMLLSIAGVILTVICYRR